MAKFRQGNLVLTSEQEIIQGNKTILSESGAGELNSLALSTGPAINEFSVDGTLVGDSDSAVPTEQAVKTYVDNHAGGTTSTYIHTQAVDSTEWTVIHMLGVQYVNVEVFNDLNEALIPENITFTDTTSLVITFVEAISGHATVIGGSYQGASGTSGGASGTSGTSGHSGTSGTSGTSGQQGNSGTSGTSGNSGTSGTSGTSADNSVIASTRTNIAINAFNIAVNHGLSLQHMVDGIVDEFTDESGVDYKDWFLHDASGYYKIIGEKYDNVNFYVHDQAHIPFDIAFNSDGTKMYILGLGNDMVYEYTLSTAWDLSTASYDTIHFDLHSEDPTPRSISFKPDGTKMYILGYNSKSVLQYSLSTAWDLSTASYDSKSFAVNNEDTDPVGIAFSSDGAKMYMCGDDGNSAYQYSLATAWDVSTASYDSVSLNMGPQDVNPFSIVFKPDGTKMYMVGNANNTVYRYSLSTAWDLSTAIYNDENIDVNGQDSAPRGIAFKSDGTKMYLVGETTDYVYQYSLGGPWGFLTALTATITSAIETADATPSEVLGILREEDIDSIVLNTDILIYASRNGGTTYTAGTLEKKATIGATNILVASIDVSGQPSGTSMKYKVEMANQKQFKLHAASMQWR